MVCMKEGENGEGAWWARAGAGAVGDVCASVCVCEGGQMPEPNEESPTRWTVCHIRMR